MKTNTLIFIAISFFFNLLFLNGQDVVFWGSQTNHALGQSNINSGIQYTLSDTQNIIRRVKVNHTNNKIYWTCGGSNGAIKQSNLDGSDIEHLVNNYNFATIAIDETNEKIYATEGNPSSIKRCNLDGSNLETLHDSDDLILGIDIDTATNTIFWTASNSGLIYKADLDTDSLLSPSIVLASNWQLYDLRVDEINREIYFNERTENKLRKIDYDGENLTNLVSANIMGSISLDVKNNTIAWIDNDINGSTLKTSQLNGDSISILLELPDATFSGQDLFLAPPVIEKDTLPNCTLSIYPNPTLQELTISVANNNNEDLRIEILDAVGKLVSNIPFDSTQPVLDCSYLPSGIYFIRIMGKNKQIKIEKVNILESR